MENAWMSVLTVFSFAIVILGIIGMIKERDIRIKYAGVFGRLSAYLFLSCALSPFPMVASAIMSRKDLVADGSIWFITIGSVVLFGVAVLVALRAFKRCPEALRKGMFPSLLLLGAGVSLRIGLRIILFFFPLIWKAGLPSKEEIERAERRREQEELADEFSRSMFRQTGVRPIVDSVNMKYKMVDSDLWEEIPLR